MEGEEAAAREQIAAAGPLSDMTVLSSHAALQIRLRVLYTMYSVLQVG